MHKNKEIRQEIKSVLETWFAGTGTAFSDLNVFDYRIEKVDPDRLPVIAIYTLAEGAEISSDRGNYMRRVETKVVLTVSGKDGSVPLGTGEISIDEKLDNLQEEVEGQLLKKRNTLNKIIHELIYLGFIDSVDPDSGTNFLTRVMNFQANYRFVNP